MYRIAIDIGGTFTDVVLQKEETGEIYGTKTPTTTKDQSIGLMNGLRKICHENQINITEIKSIIHGTTVATNAVLEGKGAKVGLITTEGFENILHVARSWTPAPISAWIGYIKPDPIADLIYTRGAKERMTAKGKVYKEIDENDVRSKIKELYSEGIESLTISLLNSYANNKHEIKIREIATSIDPTIPVTISNDILPEFREYERTLTTVMNSYVRPPMERYLNNLSEKIDNENITTHINIVRSDGGLMSVEAAASRPVYTMLSGPSGGVTASALIGKQTGNENIISFDMGGTSTDVSLTYKGKPRISRETRVGDFPVSAPSLEVVSIGAGGGSIAHVPLTGALRVGPQSSGAEPGPACYNFGGKDPTVTDANLLLGYLPESLVGGEMKLNINNAKDAIGKIAEALDVDIYEAAEGIYNIVNENMLGATRVVSVEKGYDPRGFSLLALGGAGPIHANAIGKLSSSFPVIIPQTPGVLSALGFLQSDIRNEYSKSLIKNLEDIDMDEMNNELQSLGNDARNWLTQENVSATKQKVTYEVDVRYYRQGHEINLAIEEEDLHENGLEYIRKRFNHVHMQSYGFQMEASIEIVNIRAIAIGLVDSSGLPTNASDQEDASGSIVNADHQAYFNGEFITSPIYDRKLLKPNNRIEGPAIIIQEDSTTLLLPNYVAEVDEYLNLIINEE